MSRLARLAVVTSHPIQNQTPWFRALAQVVDLEVLFCHRQDPAGQAAAGFGQPFEWDVPLVDGYRHRWLDNVAQQPQVASFGGCDTPSVGAVLRQGAFDACIVTGWYLKSYLQAILACRQVKVPVMMRGDSQLGTPRPRWAKVAKYLPYRLLLDRVDAHLYVGKANRAYLRHYGVPSERLFFVPHFVDNGRFHEAADRARRDGSARRFLESAGVPVGATVFLFAGKLTPNKRATDLIQALAGLRACGRLVHGLIVGSGPEEGHLRAQAATLQAPVSFAGFRNQSEMPVTYAASDCLVLPSSSETWGLVVNEAMACGLPAIVTDAVGSAPDLVDAGVTGFSYRAGEVPALWESMARVLDHLEADRGAFRPAVLAKIGRYDCDAAVTGTMTALDAVTPAARRAAAEARPVLSRGHRL